MVVSIRQFMSGGTTPPQAFAYKYDQLNRITGAELYTNFDLATNAWQAGGSGSTTYKESFTYDHNGNIIRQNRNGNAAQVNLDQLKYYYYNAAGGTYDPEISTPQNATNRLAYVTDGVAAGNYGDDIDNQSANNYTYDQIGQLTGDVQEQIGSIVWNVQNKIRSVTRTTGSTKADLEFKYDAMGQRMVKIAKPRTGGSASTQENWVYTYYVRDAQGNVMATYERKLPKTGGTYKDQIKLKEQHLYGSSRAGMRQVDLLLTAKDYTFNSYNGLLLSGTFQTQTSNPASQTSFVRMVGQKVYEMANHLGNVLVTVTDGRGVLNSGSVVTGYNAVIKSAMDYSAFGVVLEGRKFVSASGEHRYDFNGKETDQETYWQDYGFRVYNPKLGKFLSEDPLTKDYPWYTPYQFAGNKPIWAIDLDGLEEYIATDFYNAAGQLYKTQITIIGAWHTASTTGPHVIVHRSSVEYAANGNATVTYNGSSTSLDGTNPFGGVELFYARGNMALPQPAATPPPTPYLYLPSASPFSPNGAENNDKSFDLLTGATIGGTQVNPGIPNATNTFELLYNAPQPNPQTSAALPNGINAVPTNVHPDLSTNTDQGGQTLNTSPSVPFAGGTLGTVNQINNVASAATLGQAIPNGNFTVTINSTVTAIPAGAATRGAPVNSTVPAEANNNNNQYLPSVNQSTINSWMVNPR
jgi:RHS repeat-associated protein